MFDISVKGYEVLITTTEPYRNKIKWEGKLLDRTEDSVRITVKGKVYDIPRPIIQEVRLPEPEYEEDDIEMKKLKS